MDTYSLPGPDWFSHNIPAWQEIFRSAGAPRLVLEIGAYEGRSTTWIAENLLAPGGELVVVDHWRGSATHDPESMAGVEARFDANLEVLRRRLPGARIEKVKAPAIEALARLIATGRTGAFDFVYVDGSHEAADVIADAVLAYQLLRVGGLLGFDDYGWRRFSDVNDSPKAAVDAFANLRWIRMELVCAGYQVFLRKLA